MQAVLTIKSRVRFSLSALMATMVATTMAISRSSVRRGSLTGYLSALLLSLGCALLLCRRRIVETAVRIQRSEHHAEDL